MHRDTITDLAENLAAHIQNIEDCRLRAKQGILTSEYNTLVEDEIQGSREDASRLALEILERISLEAEQ